MFIIPAAGMAKAVMVVTISLHPGAQHVPASYTVHQGDTLSAIAAHAYGSSADWPAIWWANRPAVMCRRGWLTPQWPPSRLRRRSRPRRRPKPRREAPRRGNPPRPLRSLPRQSLARPRRPRAGRTGPLSRPVSPAGTGAPTPATASTVACSSPSRPGSPMAAASTLLRRTWPVSRSRSPWPTGCWPARASAPGRCAGPAAKTTMCPDGRDHGRGHQVHVVSSRPEGCQPGSLRPCCGPGSSPYGTFASMRSG